MPYCKFGRWFGKSVATTAKVVHNGNVYLPCYWELLLGKKKITLGCEKTKKKKEFLCDPNMAVMQSLWSHYMGPIFYLQDAVFVCMYDNLDLISVREMQFLCAWCNDNMIIWIWFLFTRCSLCVWSMIILVRIYVHL